MLDQTEKALLESNERYKHAFEATEEGIWEFDPISGIAYFSRRWYTILGYAPGELQARYDTWTDLLHPGDRPEAEKTVKNALNHPEKSFHIEYRMRTKQGDYRWIRSRGKAIRCSSGGTPTRIVGTHLDVTHKKKLKDQFRLIQFIYNRASVGIFRAGIDSRILDVNERSCSMLGYSRDELLNMTIHDIDPTITVESWRDHWNNAKPNEIVIFETSHLCKDGKSLPVEITANFIEFDGSLYSISFSRDLSETKRMKEALLQAQKMESIGILAGGIAHDFNNLLQVINGYTQLLLHDKSGDDSDYYSLSAVQDAGRRASRLVRQLLLFSRKADSTQRPIDLLKEVEQVKRMLERTIPKMVEINIAAGNRLWAIDADPVQIEQMLLNLGTNAADAMPDGGKLLLRVENTTLEENNANQHLVAKPGNYVLLTVADNGHGMEEKTINKIFDPFFTTKEFGKGTGLGLASAYGIVKSHNGYITCASQVGEGTTFKIYFPAIIQPEVEETTETEAKPIPRGTEKVLLVDDEEAIMDFAQQSLVMYGYMVLTASRGEKALDIYSAKSNDIDLIIMDLGMPGMGGHKCLQELIKYDPQVKVIITSGYSFEGHVKKSIEAGAVRYVEKPYQLADLLKTVREVLDEKG